MSEDRRYTTLAFATDDVKMGPRKTIQPEKEEDDFEKLQREFGASYDPGPDRPRVFLNQDDDEDDFEFLEFDEPDENITERSAFLKNIKVIGLGEIFALITLATILIGYILVRCIRGSEDY